MDVAIHVKGMDCAHCERMIKDAIKELTGVQHVDVHLDQGRVHISYDQEIISLEEICDVIEEQGYEVDR